jgi:uncharacterized protein YkwD
MTPKASQERPPVSLPRRPVPATPPPVSTQSAGVRQVTAAAAPPALRPAVLAAPAPRVSIGTGQWGLINADRAANGLPPLQWSPCLAAIATQNAARMAAQGYISHADGVYLDLGCHLDNHAGENVGYLSSGINDAQMNALFMASPEHRANILGPYRYVGVAWVVASSGAAYIVVEFS